jgi:hypothetical protein
VCGEDGGSSAGGGTGSHGLVDILFELEPPRLMALLSLMVLETFKLASAPCNPSLRVQKSRALPLKHQAAPAKEELVVVLVLPPPSFQSRLAPPVAAELSRLPVVRQNERFEVALMLHLSMSAVGVARSYYVLWNVWQGLSKISKGALRKTSTQQLLQRSALV